MGGPETCIINVVDSYALSHQSLYAKDTAGTPWERNKSTMLLMPLRGNFKSIFVGNILHKLPYPVLDGEPSYLRMSALNSTQRRFLCF